MDGFLLLYQRQRELHRYIIQEWELGLNLTFLIFFHSFLHLKIDHKITRSSRAFYGLSTPPCRPCRIRYSVMDVLISANEAIFEHRMENPMGNSRDISRYIEIYRWWSMVTDPRKGGKSWWILWKLRAIVMSCAGLLDLSPVPRLSCTGSYPIQDVSLQKKRQLFLVGGWVSTPLKNMTNRQLGWIFHSQIWWERHKIHVPNHQPVYNHHIPSYSHCCWFIPYF